VFGRSLASRLDLPADRLSRLGLFVAIAVVQYAANALARAASEALFLAKAGAEAVPVYLILVGLTCVPVAGAMSRLIDRMPKTKLYRYSLILAVTAAVGLRALVPIGTKPVWFAILIGVVLIEMLLNIQFWVLVANYFTTIEQKRLIAALTVALAAGAALGGGMANVLVQGISTANLLLAFPLLYLGVFALLIRLDKSEQPLEGEEEGEGGEESLGASLRSLPALLAEYPIIALMAVVGFFDVLLGAVGSYLSYTVYTQAFPDEHRLTEFLGTLKAVLAVLEVVLVTFVTRPLIQKLGVGRMNVVYPATSLVSFVGLAASPGVATGVVTNVNFDTASASLNNPVENLTYNAVPPRFLGRVRSISEGVLQPSGLTIGGLLLAAVQTRFSFKQITLGAIGLGVVHVALGWWRGRKYVAALTTQLTSRAVDLSSADGHRVKIPPQYAEEVDRLLSSTEGDTRAFGLELAARLGADRFLPTARGVLDHLEGRSLEAGVNFLAAIHGKRERGELLELLHTGSTQLQALVLEAQLRLGDSLDPAALAPLLTSPDAKVRGLARAASLRGESAPAGPLLTRDPELGDDGLAAVARGARASADRKLLPALVEAMMRGAPGTRATAIEGLVAIAPLGERYASVLDLVEMELESDDPRVRSAALALIGKEDRARLALVARGLEDSHAMVRRRAAETLGAVGEAAIPYLSQALGSQRPEVVDAALGALGAVRTQSAADAALAYLAADFARVERNRRWRTMLPAGDDRWFPLETVLTDSDRRAIDQVLRVLGAFGHNRILRHARQALRGRDIRMRANAVEALSSIPQRRFVLPVLHLLEALAEEGGGAATDRAEGVLSLDELIDLDDRWVRVAAVEVTSELGRPLRGELRSDPDPLMSATVEARLARKETPMSRLLFLKRIALFQDLSLDDLLALDGVLRRNDYLAEETIFDEGTIGEDFFLINNGEVSVRAGQGAAQREVARLKSGDFFGEMALFDDEPRSATCVAATPCTLLVLDRSRFYSLIEQLPQLGVAICRTLSQRLRRTERDLRAARASQTT
jgi:HEAT repeat protein